MTTEKPENEVVQEETVEETVVEEEATPKTTNKKKKAPKMIIQDDHVNGDVLRVITFTSNEKPGEVFKVVATSPSAAARLVGINTIASLRNVSMEDYNPE